MAGQVKGSVEREVRVGLMTYLSPSGRWVYAQLGDKVEVHPSDAERFDRLNPEPVEADPEPVGALEDGSTVQAPDREDGVSLADLDLNGLRALAAERAVDLTGITTKKATIAAILAAETD